MHITVMLIHHVQCHHALEIGRTHLWELAPRRDLLWTRSLVVDGPRRPIAGSYFIRIHLIPLYSKHLRPHLVSWCGAKPICRAVPSMSSFTPRHYALSIFL